MTRQAWFCPSCQKHHAPHVDTCPGGTGGIGLWPPATAPYPIPGSAGDVPTWTGPWVSPDTTTCSVTVLPDPNLIVVN